MLSICQLRLQLPFDETVPLSLQPAADVDSVSVWHTVNVCCSDSGTVVIVCVFVQLLTIMIRGSYVSYSFL